MWDEIKIVLVIINIIALVLLFKSILLDKPKPIQIDRVQPWEIQRLIEEEIQRRVKNGR